MARKILVGFIACAILSGAAYAKDQKKGRPQSSDFNASSLGDKKTKPKMEIYRGPGHPQVTRQVLPTCSKWAIEQAKKLEAGSCIEGLCNKQGSPQLQDELEEIQLLVNIQQNITARLQQEHDEMNPDKIAPEDLEGLRSTVSYCQMQAASINLRMHAPLTYDDHFDPFLKSPDSSKDSLLKIEYGPVYNPMDPEIKMPALNEKRRELILKTIYDRHFKVGYQKLKEELEAARKKADGPVDLQSFGIVEKQEKILKKIHSPAEIARDYIEKCPTLTGFVTVDDPTNKDIRQGIINYRKHLKKEIKRISELELHHLDVDSLSLLFFETKVAEELDRYPQLCDAHDRLVKRLAQEENWKNTLGKINLLGAGVCTFMTKFPVMCNVGNTAGGAAISWTQSSIASAQARAMMLSFLWLDSNAASAVDYIAESQSMEIQKWIDSIPVVEGMKSLGILGRVVHQAKNLYDIKEKSEEINKIANEFIAFFGAHTQVSETLARQLVGLKKSGVKFELSTEPPILRRSLRQQTIGALPSAIENPFVIEIKEIGPLPKNSTAGLLPAFEDPETREYLRAQLKSGKRIYVDLSLDATTSGSTSRIKDSKTFRIGSNWKYFDPAITKKPKRPKEL